LAGIPRTTSVPGLLFPHHEHPSRRPVRASSR
jgi:hypothetical protein